MENSRWTLPARRTILGHGCGYCGTQGDYQRPAGADARYSGSVGRGPAGLGGTPALAALLAGGPLDGTKEFIKRNGEFTVNIALIENGKPILGVVYAPVMKVMYGAEKGKAWKEECGVRKQIQVRDARPPLVVISRSRMTRSCR